MQVAAGVLTQQFAEARARLDAALRAVPAVPARSGSDMRDLLAQDQIEDRDSRLIAQVAQLDDHPGRHVEAARLQHPRHQRHPRQAVVRRLLGHFPQAVVGIEVAVIVAQLAQPVAQKDEMTRLIVRHLHPIGIERRRQATEAVHRIPGQVDGIQFDMRDGVDERRPPHHAAQPATREFAWMHERRLRWTPRHADRLGRCRIGRDREFATREGIRVLLRQRDLRIDLRRIQAGAGGLEQRGHAGACRVSRRGACAWLRPSVPARCVRSNPARCR